MDAVHEVKFEKNWDTYTELKRTVKTGIDRVKHQLFLINPNIKV